MEKCQGLFVNKNYWGEIKMDEEREVRVNLRIERGINEIVSAIREIESKIRKVFIEEIINELENTISSLRVAEIFLSQKRQNEIEEKENEFIDKADESVCEAKRRIKDLITHVKKVT